MANFTCVHIDCYPQDVCSKVFRRAPCGEEVGSQQQDARKCRIDRLERAMSENGYSWEPAVRNALTATPETVACKIDIANRAIAERLNDREPPDACETSVLLYALEALDTLGALRLVIDAQVEGPASK